MTAKAILIAAPRSGSGKTTVTLALLAALRRRAVGVAAAKCGPDYIDPAFHAAATGVPCLNLDGWAMGQALLESVLHDAAVGADLLVIEAAMGLFDGVAGAARGGGSAASLAATFGLPILIVLDVSGQAQSAAAVVKGFADFDPRVRIAGVILNRVASPRHRAMIEPAVAALGIPVVGAIPRDDAIVLPERHLGLVQALEHDDLEDHLDRLADLAERHCNLALIQNLATRLSAKREAGAAAALPPPGQRIALAHDESFAFIYPHLLEGWRRAGAEIVRFSPLADEPPPDACDCCWLPGGYPELHAATLANGHRFKQGLAQFAATRPVHGECGGYMVLGEAIIDADGARHAMTGLLGHATSFAARRLHLGYRQAELCHDCPLGRAGAALHGHEFHYASLVEPGRDDPLCDLADGEGNALGPAGGRRGNVTGGFFHAIAAAPIGRGPKRYFGGARMSVIAGLDDLRAALAGLPGGDDAAATAIARRQSRLTKPQGSLGRLEDLAAWLGRWQGRAEPRLAHVEVLVFAGNHGIADRGVSAYPATVTAQMVANFERGGAAINQICKTVGATLRVIPLRLEMPTADFTKTEAMTEAEFIEAVAEGVDAVPTSADLICLGEMGIGNTTAASALAAALLGGGGERWAGRGTGLDDPGLARKRAAINAGLARHDAALSDPLRTAMALGGRELAAILGATLAARRHGIPVVLDGFIATAAAAPLARLRRDALDHVQVAHCSAEAGHRGLCAALGFRPILDLDMRLGEASGAALSVAVLRAALACHLGMATFDEAQVDERR